MTSNRTRIRYLLTIVTLTSHCCASSARPRALDRAMATAVAGPSWKVSLPWVCARWNEQASFSSSSSLDRALAGDHELLRLDTALGFELKEVDAAR
jgi:hypothetical protein